ncbi:MAG: type VI secretion system tube protein Hcp [Verrucomicrobiae bacterium]|nr:type VI secretion system tube protein Hcp [Verrucomicrobiae bacterium]
MRIDYRNIGQRFIALVGLLWLSGGAAISDPQFWLYIEGVPGESTTDGRKEWMDGVGWEWSGTSFPEDERRETWIPKVSVLTISKFMGVASPHLLNAMTSGRVFPTVWLDVEYGPVVFQRFALRNAGIRSVNYELNSDNGEMRPLERYELYFSKVEMGYGQGDPRFPDGKLTADTVTHDVDRRETTLVPGLPTLNDGDRDGIDDLIDRDKDNNGIADTIESLPVAATPGRAGITGSVWLDSFRNSRQDPSEAPVTAMRVELFRQGSDIPVAARTVNATTGSYAFLDLDPGAYQVRFVPGRGLQIGPATGDSTPDPTTGFTPSRLIAGGRLVTLSAAVIDSADAYSAFAFDDFGTVGSALNFAGDATIKQDEANDQAVLQLTSAFPQISGSAFTRESAVVSTFSTHFRFRMLGTGIKGDGFTFTVASGRGLGFRDGLLGRGGDQLGYGGIPSSFAVEFDTISNGETNQDPAEAHVGILTNGSVVNVATETALTTPLGTINNGAVWDAWIDYDGTTLEVRLSPTPVRPQQPLVSAPLDFAAILPSAKARVGFTAATFSATQAHEIISWEYEGGENNTFEIAASTSQAELNAVTKAPGSIIIEGESRTALTMNALGTVCGDLIIRNNTALRSINLPQLTEVLGEIIIEGNDALLTADLPKLRQVGGNIRINTSAQVQTDLSNVQSENLSIVGVALQNVVGKTGFGSTTVNISNANSRMTLDIPEGTFPVPEVFEVQPLNEQELENFAAGAIDSTGTPVDVGPVLGFEYGFSGGGLNLNREVQVQFEIDLRALDADSKRTLILAYEKGTLTVFGARSASEPIEVFAVCNVLDFAVWDNCAQVRALDGPGGTPVADPFNAGVLEFTVYAQHFSTYGVAMIEPIAIGEQSIRDAAEKVGSTLGIAVNESTGATTLSWDSFSVAATTDSAYVHPAYRVQISTDLEIWKNTGTPASLQILSDATSSRTVTISSTNQKTGAGSEDTYYRIVLTSP